jgi:SAM-dependent methyltransferase
LLQAALREFVTPGSIILDVGSADGPSVDWLEELGRRIPLDADPRGLRPGGVCASAVELPFRDGALDAITAFDVVEHFPDDIGCLDELRRVLRPGGRLLISVPAYKWAWSSFDVQAGHYRRYSRATLTARLRQVGFTIERATYAFAATLPLFAGDRLRARLRGHGALRVAKQAHPEWLERRLLGLARLDEAVLRRRRLPFGSSIFVAASLA